MNKDRIYLYNLFEKEKNLGSSYNLFLNECSNDYLYENIFSIYEDITDTAREIYNYICSKYNVDLKDANSKKLCKEIEVLEEKLEEI